MNIGVIGNADPLLPIGVMDKLEEAAREGDQFVHIDGRKRSIPKDIDVVLIVSSTLGHDQVDRFVGICRRDGLKYVRTPHHWSTLISHCRREGLLPKPEIVVTPTPEVEAIFLDPEEMELTELRTRLTQVERELSTLRRAQERRRRAAQWPRKLDRPPAPMQDRPTLDPSHLPHLVELSRDPRRRSRMNILCTAIEVGLDVDVESMLQRVERS